MIQADALIDDGGGSSSGGSDAPSSGASSTPRIAVPRGGATDGSGGTVIGGHTLGGGGASDPSGVETVSQAYLAALAAMGKNTSGDTSPYVIMSPGAGTGAGSSIGLGTVLIVGALALGAWWYMKRRKGE